MELKEFISETLKQIADGIKEGHEYIVKAELGHGISDRRAITVAFDLALSVTESDRGTLGAKVGVAQIFSAGGDKENSRTSSSENRIKFELIVFIHANGDRNIPNAF